MVAPTAVSPSGPLPEGGLPAPAPRSPTPRRTRRPSWLDLRLVTGVVLVVGSVLLGAVVVSRASQSTAVWSLRRDLPAGAVLAAGDLTPVDVRLGDATGSYVGTARAVVGTRLATAVRAGQLLPVAALAAGGSADLVTVSIPFDPADAPDIERGDVITVWASTATCTSAVLLAAVGVQEVSDAGSGLSATRGLDVVVSVSPTLADRVVGALSLDGVTLRAGVLSAGAPATTDPDGADLPDLSVCGSATAGPAASPTAS